MPIVAPSCPPTHNPSRTAKFRGAFANHFKVKWLVMAESKSSPGVSDKLDQLANYPFFTPPMNAGYALFVDIDRPGAVLDVYAMIPPEIAPSWVIETPNGAQAGWLIDPVDLRENAREHPVRYARAVGHALAQAADGDPLVDPLTPSRVRNPAYEQAGTFAAPNPPVYRLGQLRDALKAADLWPEQRIIFQNRHPAIQPLKQTIEKGERNTGIFDASRFVAYAGGDFEAEAWAANDRCDVPLASSEVKHIINSISRFMAHQGRTRVNGPTTAMPEAMRKILSEMGRRGGLRNTPAQRAARAKGPIAAAAARKRRAVEHTKKAQHLRRKGYSRAEIAARLGRDPSTVSRYLRRWIPISTTDMLACITGASGGVSILPPNTTAHQSRLRVPQALPHCPPIPPQGPSGAPPLPTLASSET